MIFEKNRGKMLLLVILAAAALLLLSGCTGTTGYEQCCVRSRIYDTSTTPNKILADPNCYFPDGTAFGPCDKTKTEKLNGTAECYKTTCNRITTEGECKQTTTCSWSLIGTCTGGNAYVRLPVCTDAIPKNCMNESCKAMVCGYTSPKVGPPPTSNDFKDCTTITTDTECTGGCQWSYIDSKCTGTPKPFSSSRSYNTPAINLLGTSCQFPVMDSSFYNKYKQSQGKLWVNAFRFGVGQSFADYEQSRYFFPTSDRFCAATVLPGKDRFINYVNAPTTWCGDFQAQNPGQPFFHCQLNKLNFSDLATCQGFCQGQVGGTQGCIDSNSIPPVTPAQPVWPKYWCRDTDFVFNTAYECQTQCQLLSNPSACSADTTKFPFLQPDGRLKTQIQEDFVYSTNTVRSTSGLFSNGEDEYKESCRQDNWRNEGGMFDLHWQCNDNYPWECGGSGDCLWSNWDSRWPFSRVFSLDINTNDYASTLKSQMPILPNLKKGVFECENSADCLSGTCDKTQYSRTVCLDEKDPTKSTYIDCGCTPSGYNLDCGAIRNGISGSPWNTLDTFLQVGVYNGISKSIPSNIKFGTSIAKDDAGNDISGKDAIYHIIGNYNPADLKFLDPNGCNVQPNWQGPACIMYVDLPVGSQVERRVLIDGGITNWLDCENKLESIAGNNPITSTPWGYSKIEYVRRYQMSFSSSTNPANSWGRLGNCKLTADMNIAEAPYLDTITFGWCQACTQSTLAVQKVDFNAANAGWNYRCLDFRGTYRYDTSTGSEIGGSGSPGGSTNGYGSPMSLNVAPILRSNVGVSQNVFVDDGTIARGALDQGWFGHDVSYLCTDGWTGDWHQITLPDQAYLVNKMTSYMRANIMPVLTFDSANTPLHVATTAMPDPNNLYTFINAYDTKYDPVDICTTYGADGGAIYNVGTVADIEHAATDFGIVYTGDKNKDNVANTQLTKYFDTRGDISPSNPAPGLVTLNGRASVIYKAMMLKAKCKTAPITAIDVGNPIGQDLNTLISYKDPVTGDYSGTLHGFFYNPQSPDAARYMWRLATTTPDDAPNNIDMFLQEWTPMCDKFSSTQDAVQYEVESELKFSRALMANFSKPTLIWKFHFPAGSKCADPVSGYNRFLNYVFDHQSDMVDAGIIGLVYDTWLTDNGNAWVTNVNAQTAGTTPNLASASSGPLDTAAGKTDIFCALQNASRKVQGITKMTYGQKIYAESPTCECQPCTQSNIIAGMCVRDPLNTEVITAGNQLPQLFCMDGKQCALPSNPLTLPSGAPNYGAYTCPHLCATPACELCSASTSSAYCRVDTNDKTYETMKSYADLASGNYWELLAALPNKDKCCLTELDQKGNQVKYTYTQQQGVKQSNELLQYPRRGDANVDCGRPVSTDVLKYCGVNILNSNIQAFCSKV